MIEYELRELKSQDMFPMFGILSKIGFSDLKEMMTPDRMEQFGSMFKNDESEQESNTDMETLFGMNMILEVVQIIMKNLPSCESDIYKFLSGLSGMTEKEIKNLDMVTFTDMIVTLIQKQEFKDFFKVVSRLFK